MEHHIVLHPINQFEEQRTQLSMPLSAFVLANCAWFGINLTVVWSGFDIHINYEEKTDENYKKHLETPKSVNEHLHEIIQYRKKGASKSHFRQIEEMSNKIAKFCRHIHKGTHIHAVLNYRSAVRCA